MSEQSNAPGAGFWVIGVLALLWYLIGFAMYYGFVTATPEQLAEQLNDAQLAVINATPTWVTAANAIAVTAAAAFRKMGSLMGLIPAKSTTEWIIVMSRVPT